MRCFAAVELDAAMRAPLAHLLERRRPIAGVRWCTPDQLHVTLKFLGDVPDARLPALCEALSAASAGIPVFDLALGALGCFPPTGPPRVLWCGVQDVSEGCRRWLQAADPEFGLLGFELEKRPFRPHITLARCRDGRSAAAIRSWMELGAEPLVGRTRVEKITLFESRLEQAGARYHALFHAPLAAARLDTRDADG